jgi:hypothetical protein
MVVASNAPSDCIGTGGAPGESVILKAGASAIEPLPVLTENGLRMNVDKGEQAAGGPAASVVGNIANGLPCDAVNDTPYATLMRRHTHPVPVTANSDGELWLLVGTDSGFESLTALYYERIDVALLPLPQ